MTRHLWDKIVDRRLCAPVIGGLAAALTGAGTALGAQGVPISTCNYNVTAPGSYSLVVDLTCPVGVNGINIFASNVTLKLNGHSITGPQSGGGSGGTGIVVSNNVPSPTPQIQNVQVQGPGLIQDFANGMYLQAVSNSQVNDVVLVLNSYGIVTNFGTNDQFKGNVAAQNTTAGFDLRDSNDQVQLNALTANGVIENNMVGLIGVGIEIEGNGNVVFNNSADGNLNTGIYIHSGNNNQIHANTAFGNTSYGIAIQGAEAGATTYTPIRLWVMAAARAFPSLRAI